MRDKSHTVKTETSIKVAKVKVVSVLDYGPCH